MSDSNDNTNTASTAKVGRPKKTTAAASSASGQGSKAQVSIPAPSGRCAHPSRRGFVCCRFLFRSPLLVPDHPWPGTPLPLLGVGIHTSQADHFDQIRDLCTWCDGPGAPAFFRRTDFFFRGRLEGQDGHGQAHDQATGSLRGRPRQRPEDREGQPDEPHLCTDHSGCGLLEAVRGRPAQAQGHCHPLQRCRRHGPDAGRGPLPRWTHHHGRSSA